MYEILDKCALIVKLGELYDCGEHASIVPLLSSLVGPGCAQPILEGYIATPLVLMCFLLIVLGSLWLE